MKKNRFFIQISIMVFLVFNFSCSSDLSDTDHLDINEQLTTNSSVKLQIALPNNDSIVNAKTALEEEGSCCVTCSSNGYTVTVCGC